MYKNLEKIKIKYKEYFSLVNDWWNAYEKSYKKRNNKDFYLFGFRKHCIYTEENVSHNCLAKENNGDKNCRFIIVNNIDDKKGIKFVICENCKKVYYSYFILARCYKCKVRLLYIIIIPRWKSWYFISYMGKLWLSTINKWKNEMYKLPWTFLYKYEKWFINMFK